MAKFRFALIDAYVAVTFFTLAALSIVTTRLDGGLALVWLATPYLIAVLMRRPRRDWPKLVAWCAASSMAATGLLGVGWAAAPFLAVANLAEAVVAALLLRRSRSALMRLGSLRWTWTLIRCAGLAGPATMAALAFLPMWVFAGQQPVETLIRVGLGHGLSNLTFIPIFTLFLTGANGLWRNRIERWTVRKDAPLFLLFVVVTALVFLQRSMSLLFLPLLPLTAITFSGGSRRSAVALLLLAGLGGAATLTGRGPLFGQGIPPGREIEFLQFYLLATVMTVVPIAAQLRSRRLLARRVRDSESRYRMLADHSSDVIAHSDLDGRLLFVSPSMVRVTGIEPRNIVGRSLFELIHHADHARLHDAMGRAIATPREVQRAEFRAQVGSGEWRWFESLSRSVLGRDGRVEGLVSIVRDIGERKQREEALAKAALTDPLTGLPNRRAFRDRALELVGQAASKTSAIALIDIDHFKQVNDRFGHDWGDEVLRTFAGLVEQLLGPEDLLARIGGEEFGILFAGIDLKEAGERSERIRAAVASTPIVTPAGRIDITISGGVAALGAGGLDSALRSADQALYAAKSGGRDRLSLAA